MQLEPGGHTQKGAAFLEHQNIWKKKKIWSFPQFLLLKEENNCQFAC